jgi:hypothetical protein
MRHVRGVWTARSLRGHHREGASRTGRAPPEQLRVASLVPGPGGSSVCRSWRFVR